VRLTTYHHPVPLSRNLGALTSWNPLGLSRHVIGLIYFFTFRVLTEIKSNEMYELNEIINKWVILREIYKMRTLTSC